MSTRGGRWRRRRAVMPPSKGGQMSGASGCAGSTCRRKWDRRATKVIAWLLTSLAMLLAAVGAASAKPMTRAASGPAEPKHPASCGSKPILIAYVSALANTYGQAIEKGLRSFLSTCSNVKVVDFDTEIGR